MGALRFYALYINMTFHNIKGCGNLTALIDK